MAGDRASAGSDSAERRFGVSDGKALEKRVRQNLEQLNADLVALELECRAARERTDDALALSDFKRLNPLFDAIVSFVAVLHGQATFLDEQRRQEVELHLRMLLGKLGDLQLSTVESLLGTVTAGSSPLPLGTRYVMDRWRSNLPTLNELYFDGRRGSEVTAWLERIDALARSIGERSPDLPDFSDPRPHRPAELPPPGRMAAQASVTHGQSHREAEPTGLRLAVNVKDGKAFIDARTSSLLLAELRRHHAQTELGAALGIPTANLLMVLNGRDPFAPDRIERFLAAVQGIVGEDRVVFSQG